MKRIIVFIIALCLVFGSISPCYAQIVQVEEFQGSGDWNENAHNVGGYTFAVFIKDKLTTISSVLSTISSRVNTTNSRLNTIINALTDNSNSYLLTNMLTQIQKLTHIADQIDFFLGSDGTTTITQNWSEFTADMYKLVRFLAPVSSNLPGSGNNFMTLWDYVFYEAGMINQLWGGWDTYFSELPGIHSDASSIRTNVSYLPYALVNYYRESDTLTPTMRRINAHFTLVNEDGSYSLVGMNDDGTFRTYNVNWKNGSPLGNIALINRTGNGAIIQALSRQVAYYNDTLSIWDSQGNTLTQETWVPKSAINGLYKYFAYTQRDVARLTYVLASDEEIEAREKARENQSAVLDNFINSEGDGAVDDNDFGDIANASGSIKDNFNTGVNPSGIFSIFSTDDKATPWFSNETKNELMPQTRAGYSTPLLDEYYEEIMGVFDNAH